MNLAGIFFMLLLLAGNSDSLYQKAESAAGLVLSTPHEEQDSTPICGEKMRSIVFRDSVLNKPGGIGTEYNYPIYQYETEIVYYKDRKIAAFEKKEIQMKRYEYGGVTTGISITTVMDPLHTFYFDEQQNLITHSELLKIQAKICKED